MLLAVDVPGGRHLVDVGFGGGGPEQLREVLRDRFGLSFPAGTRFSAPLFPD